MQLIEKELKVYNELYLLTNKQQLKIRKFLKLIQNMNNKERILPLKFISA